MEPPLRGIKVLDLTTVLAGPYGAAILADLGADVIKIEEANELGDTYRFAGTMRVVGGRPIGASFATVNRGKRAIALNLKTDAGRKVLLELVKDADAFVQNMRPGVADRLGVGYDALRAVNNRLIYVSVSGYGQTGPNSHQPVYDPLVQARAGFVTTQQRIGGAARGQPNDVACLMNTAVVDKVTAMTWAQALVSALYARDCAGGSRAGGTAGQGQGQHIEINMLDAALAFAWPDLYVDQTFVEPADANAAKRMPVKRKKMLIQEGYSAFPCRDGRHVVFSANAGILVQEKWEAMCRGFGLEQLLQEPRMKSPGRRMHALHEIFAAFDGATRKMTVEEVDALMHSIDVGVAPVLDCATAIEQPQVQHNGSLVVTGNNGGTTEQQLPLGPMRQAVPAARFSATPAIASPTQAPLYGQHTEELLKELGYAPQAIAKLASDGHVHLGFAAKPASKL